MYEWLKEILRTYPVVAGGMFTVIGVLIAGSVNLLTQWFMMRSNRNAEANKKRKEAYAKWIALYQQKLLLYFDHYTSTEVTFKELLVRRNNYLMKNAQPNKEWVDRDNRKLDELEKIHAEQQNNIRDLHIKLREVKASVFMYDNKKSRLETFQKLDECTPNIDVRTVEKAKKSLEEFETFIDRKSAELDKFSAELYDGLP